MKEQKGLTFEQVGKYINSLDFVRLLAEINFKTQDGMQRTAGKLIGIAFDYVDIFSDSGNTSLDELEKILRKVASGIDYFEIFKMKFFKELGVNEKLTKEEDLLVKNEIIKKLGFKSTKFHAFNGNFLDSIKEKGINPEAKAQQSEQDELNQLHKKYGAFWRCSIKSDIGHVSYSRTASVSYHYAQTSPEWFDLMCGGMFDSRDYQGAKKIFIDTANKCNFTPEDKKRYLELFEICWNKFVANKTLVAIVPDVVQHNDFGVLNNLLKEYDSSTTFNIFVNSFRDVDCRSDKKIDTKDAYFIELPNAKELYKNVMQEKEKTENISL